MMADVMAVFSSAAGGYCHTGIEQRTSSKMLKPEHNAPPEHNVLSCAENDAECSSVLHAARHHCKLECCLQALRPVEEIVLVDP
jgi:hypothetical protein